MNMKIARGFLAVLLPGATAPLPVSAFVQPPPSHTKTKAFVQLPAASSSSRLLSATAAASAATITEENDDASPSIEGMPRLSPATALPNKIYRWRDYSVRYQVAGPPDADHTLLLIHGLFVNADHWRRQLTGLQDGGKTVRVYALDLLGSGWSDKPARDDPAARAANGENGRFVDGPEEKSPSGGRSSLQKIPSPSVLENVSLGTAAGGHRLAYELDLRHPLSSPYNFYTWGEQIADFTRDVINADAAEAKRDAAIGGDVLVDNANTQQIEKKVTLVANSIGTMSALQSILDEPALFNGCLVINPNFRELHSAEVPFAKLTMPLVRQIQSLLRNKGHGLFRALATPKTVTEILKEPYAVTDAIDDELVSVLLEPLLTKGADDVVFDTLSYSSGPLPEQQLSSPGFPRDVPVWVVYGKDDPWTPPKRVEGLRKVCLRPNGEQYGDSPVERVVGLDGVGHCPHDEDAERVNALVFDFLDRLDKGMSPEEEERFKVEEIERDRAAKAAAEEEDANILRERMRVSAEARIQAALALEEAEEEARLDAIEKAAAARAREESEIRARMKSEFQAQTVNEADAEASRLQAESEFSKEVAREEMSAVPSAGSDDAGYSEMTVVQLKDELRAKGLKVSGKKAELIERLESSQ